MTAGSQMTIRNPHRPSETITVEVIGQIADTSKVIVLSPRGFVHYVALPS